jgi:hypothetical protein
MEGLIGKLWSEVGSIDWEGRCPVLDRELRIVGIVDFDALAWDESFVPVEMCNTESFGALARLMPRSFVSDCEHDAYMARADFEAFHGMIPGILGYDLCEDTETETRVSEAFPAWAESGAIPSHFFVVSRATWDAQRFQASKRLLEAAEDQIDREYYAAAGEEFDSHIAEEDGGLVAYFYAHGEPVCCLIGCIADAIGGAE